MLSQNCKLFQKANVTRKKLVNAEKCTIQIYQEIVRISASILLLLESKGVYSVQIQDYVNDLEHAMSLCRLCKNND